jgi:hypothetical protein
MSQSRESVLVPALKIPAADVQWYFMSAYYDGPISGLAIYRGRILRFCCFPEDISKQTTYVLQELSEAELVEEKRVKRKFETMVGTHGCFDEQGELLPEFFGSDESRAQFFREEPPDSSRVPTPYDRPVVAWFDTAEK